MGPEDKVGRRSGTKCSPVRQKRKRKTAYQIIAHVRVHTRVISNRPKIVTKCCPVTLQSHLPAGNVRIHPCGGHLCRRACRSRA